MCLSPPPSCLPLSVISFFLSLCREFVSTFIQFPKPLIAAVNGPAVGVSVTLLALCDLVYAAENVRDVHVLLWFSHLL